mmetsp:Transcript_18086/g.39060  ORF Transcript_18086/g.39060 Transcript_18086/m.39060 type:complete len:129 (+) Transcript_18086:1052-1438(+)
MARRGGRMHRFGIARCSWVSNSSEKILDNISRKISAMSGVNYAVHATNGLIVAANILSGPSKRARTTAMVNNTLPMGQFVTALLVGTISHYCGGFEYTFFWFGVVGSILTTVACIAATKQSPVCCVAE